MFLPNVQMEICAKDHFGTELYPRCLCLSSGKLDKSTGQGFQNDETEEIFGTGKHVCHQDDEPFYPKDKDQNENVSRSE
ncbi:hypothetical protein TNIN_7421 [Trichonephila inaurata madagascariensis]|uniref:Uncharacterized protein n=1 Tax=Trichonephila inaurata madagascariensis TaxID=2747483 RepID=A0A8X6WTK0_9ARAC|nr:hypothetical protein TNIN_7421 [Trichonephila inaurata madagascariensis]